MSVQFYFHLNKDLTVTTTTRNNKIKGIEPIGDIFFKNVIMEKWNNNYFAYSSHEQIGSILHTNNECSKEEEKSGTMVPPKSHPKISLLKTPDKEYNVSLLKSALQKAVRLCNTKAALSIGWQLLCQSPNEFLRRLPIIMLEDCCLHPNLPFLTWMMIAHSQHVNIFSSLQNVYALMKIVVDLASFKFRDPIPEINIDNFKNPIIQDHLDSNKPIFESMNNQPKSHELNSLLVSIIIRINYGGTPGDMSMLKKFALSWDARFKNESDPWKNKIIPLWDQEVMNDDIINDTISKSPFIEECNQLEEGIDFHCFPKLIHECRSLHNQLTFEEIKRAVWYHRSGLSNKNSISDPENPIAISTNGGFEIKKEVKGRETTLTNWLKIKNDWLKITKRNLYWNFEAKNELKRKIENITSNPEDSGNSSSSSSSQNKKLKQTRNGSSSSSSIRNQPTLESFFIVKKT